jgi:large subunit ribosomal protein L19
MAISLKIKGTEIHVGDVVRIHLKLIEGEKERIQVFEGMVLGIKGRDVNKTFMVRKISSGVGVERIFPTDSPWISKIEVKKKGNVRRAKLTYVRNKSARQVAQITQG